MERLAALGVRRAIPTPEDEAICKGNGEYVTTMKVPATGAIGRQSEIDQSGVSQE